MSAHSDCQEGKKVCSCELCDREQIWSRLIHAQLWKQRESVIRVLEKEMKRKEESAEETQETIQTLNGTLVCAIGSEIQQSLPTYEQLQQKIRDRAYELWQQAGSPWGEEQNFWLQAEKDLFSVNDATGDGYRVYVRDLDDPTVNENPESWSIHVIAPQSETEAQCCGGSCKTQELQSSATI